MPVIVTAEVPGQTPEGYDAILNALRPVMEKAPGFILNAAWDTPEGWRVIEMWQTRQNATDFFAKYVHPNLPPGIKPKRTLHELHSLVKA